jgi:hypothetical protein
MNLHKTSAALAATTVAVIASASGNAQAATKPDQLLLSGGCAARELGFVS